MRNAHTPPATVAVDEREDVVFTVRAFAGRTNNSYSGLNKPLTEVRICTPPVDQPDAHGEAVDRVAEGDRQEDGSRRRRGV